MKFHPIRMYVHPDFKKNIEMLAIEKNKSVIALSRDLAKEDYENLKIQFKGWKRVNNEKDFFRQ